MLFWKKIVEVFGTLALDKPLGTQILTGFLCDHGRESCRRWSLVCEVTEEVGESLKDSIRTLHVVF